MIDMLSIHLSVSLDQYRGHSWNTVHDNWPLSSVCKNRGGVGSTRWVTPGVTIWWPIFISRGFSARGGHLHWKRVWGCAAVMTPFFQTSNRSLAYQSRGGYSDLEWVRMCGPEFQLLPYSKTWPLANSQPISKPGADPGYVKRGGPRSKRGGRVADKTRK